MANIDRVRRHATGRPTAPSGVFRLGIMGAVLSLPPIIGSSGESCASAFFVREQSASALGSAFAGATAGASDLTYIFYNGAALTQQESGFASVGSLIISVAKFRNGEASTIQGVPVGDGNGGRNGGDPSFVPALYGAWNLADSFPDIPPIRLGLAINAPFGFETQYDDNWIGRYYAVQSRIRTLDINPMVAFEPIEGVSLAAGLQVQRIDAKLTNAVDFGTLGALYGVPGAQPTMQDGFAKVVGDDWGVGWTAGLLLEPLPGTRLGAAYRSAVHHEIEGDARTQPDQAGVAAALGFPVGTTGAKARLTTPEVVSFGISQRLDDAWTVMTETTWTRWSRIRTIEIMFDDPALPPSVTEQDWRDTWFFAAGCAWRPAEQWTLRTGIAYDQSPARNSSRTPRTPINNGTMIAVGADYQATAQLGLAVGYAHWFIESAPIDLEDNAPGNALRGNLSGSSRNDVDTLSLQLTWRF